MEEEAAGAGKGGGGAGSSGGEGSALVSARPHHGHPRLSISSHARPKGETAAGAR